MEKQSLKSISKSDKVKFLTKLASGKFESGETSDDFIQRFPLKNLSDEDLDDRINDLEQKLISKGDRAWVNDIKKQFHIS